MFFSVLQVHVKPQIKFRKKAIYQSINDENIDLVASKDCNLAYLCVSIGGTLEFFIFEFNVSEDCFMIEWLKESLLVCGG